MNSWTIGIDPGVHGYMAVLECTGDNKAVLKAVQNLPRLDGNNLLELYAILAQYHRIPYASVEWPGTFTKNTAVLARQHREYAEIRACCKLLGMGVTEVIPKDWKKYFNLSRDKQLSIDLAKKLVKDLPPLALRDNDLAEACLIGIYGQVLRDYELTSVLHF